MLSLPSIVASTHLVNEGVNEGINEGVNEEHRGVHSTAGIDELTSSFSGFVVYDENKLVNKAVDELKFYG